MKRLSALLIGAFMIVGSQTAFGMVSTDDLAVFSSSYGSQNDRPAITESYVCADSSAREYDWERNLSNLHQKDANDCVKLERGVDFDEAAKRNINTLN